MCGSANWYWWTSGRCSIYIDINIEHPPMCYCGTPYYMNHRHSMGIQFIFMNTEHPPCATAVGHIFSVSEPNTHHHHHLAHLDISKCEIYENAQVHHSRTSSHCSNIKMMNVHQYLPWWKQKNIFHVLFLSIEVMEGSASLSFPNIGHRPHHISHDHISDQTQWHWQWSMAGSVRGCTKKIYCWTLLSFLLSITRVP